MITNLQRRLEALEAAGTPADGPDTILIAFVNPNGQSPEDVRLAFIIGAAGRPGRQLTREAGESADEFSARIEKEKQR